MRRKLLVHSQLKQLFALFILLDFLFAAPLGAGDVKELEKRLDGLEKENSRLRQELAMEEEASRLLGQKLLKEYDDRVVLENEIKDKDERLNALEGELGRVRKLMEDEVASYRKKIKEYKFLSDEDKVSSYIKTLEEEKTTLYEKVIEKEKEIGKGLAAIAELKKELSSREEKIQKETLEKDSGAAMAGNVLSISKEFNFIIIEFEDPEVVKTGNAFSVFREEKAIATIEVTKIRGKYVFATILDIVPGEEITEGDTVR